MGGNQRGGDGCYRGKKGRTNGSRRARDAKGKWGSRWQEQGLAIGSVNARGLSDYKLFLLLERYDLDVVCIQETWLTHAAQVPNIPGYKIVEQRRGKGRRGGIAVLVRRHLKIVGHVGNEFV